MGTLKIIDELLASLGPSAESGQGQQWAGQCARLLGLDGVAVTLEEELD